MKTKDILEIYDGIITKRDELRAIEGTLADYFFLELDGPKDEVEMGARKTAQSLYDHIKKFKNNCPKNALKSDILNKRINQLEEKCINTYKVRV